ncbi:hypothetical protein AOG23_34600, partial [Rhizobium acidisoli]
TSEVETVAISQLRATVCISQPRLESCDAKKIERNVEFFSGANSPEDARSSIASMSISLFRAGRLR